MSFVEAIIAIFIFALVMFSVMMIFTSSFGGYKKADNMAKNIENAQFAMNLMAKSLRTSKIISPSGNFSNTGTLKIFDFSDNINPCKQYSFNGTQVLVASYGGATYATDPNCTAGTFSSFAPLTAQSISGSFSGLASVPPAPGTSPGTMGKVTIQMKVCSSSTCALGGKNDSTVLQTTVSLRDYSTVEL